MSADRLVAWAVVVVPVLLAFCVLAIGLVWLARYRRELHRLRKRR